MCLLMWQLRLICVSKLLQFHGEWRKRSLFAYGRIYLYIGLCLTVKMSVCFVKLAHTDADTCKYSVRLRLFWFFWIRSAFWRFRRMRVLMCACICACRMCGEFFSFPQSISFTCIAVLLIFVCICTCALHRVHWTLQLPWWSFHWTLSHDSTILTD